MCDSRRRDRQQGGHVCCLRPRGQQRRQRRDQQVLNDPMTTTMVKVEDFVLARMGGFLGWICDMWVMDILPLVVDN